MFFAFLTKQLNLKLKETGQKTVLFNIKHLRLNINATVSLSLPPTTISHLFFYESIFFSKKCNRKKRWISAELQSKLVSTLIQIEYRTLRTFTYWRSTVQDIFKAVVQDIFKAAVDVVFIYVLFPCTDKLTHLY